MVGNPDVPSNVEALPEEVKFELLDRTDLKDIARMFVQTRGTSATLESYLSWAVDAGRLERRSVLALAQWVQLKRGDFGQLSNAAFLGRLCREIHNNDVRRVVRRDRAGQG